MLYSYEHPIIVKKKNGELIPVIDPIGLTSTTCTHLKSFCNISKAQYTKLYYDMKENKITIDKKKIHEDLSESFIKLRKQFLDELVKYFRVNKIKSLELLGTHYRVECDYEVVQEIYKKLTLKKNELYVKYETGEGFEPCEWDKIEEPLEYFSMDEIFDVINDIITE